jgi:hypothetical protein
MLPKLHFEVTTIESRGKEIPGNEFGMTDSKTNKPNFFAKD